DSATLHPGYQEKGRLSAAFFFISPRRSGRKASNVDVELDPLRQRQLRRPVDGVRLAAHVLLPRIRTRLAAAAGFLFATEGAADLRTAGADVDVGDAAVGARVGEEFLGIADVEREDRGAESLRHGVLHLD